MKETFALLLEIIQKKSKYCVSSIFSCFSHSFRKKWNSLKVVKKRIFYSSTTCPLSQGVFNVFSIIFPMHFHLFTHAFSFKFITKIKQVTGLRYQFQQIHFSFKQLSSRNKWNSLILVYAMHIQIQNSRNERRINNTFTLIW